MSDVASLLGSHVSVEWFEAVALVREVCDRLQEEPLPLVPELNQIHLSPEGHVDLAGGSRSNEPVRRLGQLLLALLANSDAPVQLRLVITQATAPSPTFRSISEYSDALGFFERPERSAVLAQLAARVAAAPQPVGGERSLTLDSVAPLPSIAKPQRDATPRTSPQAPSRAPRLALIALIVLLIAGGAAWYAWSRGVGPQNRTDASAMVNRASEAVGSAVISGASAITERIGLGRIVPASSAAPEAPAPQPAPPPAPKAPDPKPSDLDTRRDPPPPLFAFDLEERRGIAPNSPRLPAEARPNDLSIPAPPPDDRTIYTMDSPGVTPPIALRPQISQKLPEGFDRDLLGQIELVIAKNGSVESAKLLTPPRNVNDGLFLSAAKAWIFQPALIDGVPVRYRKVIWVASP